MRLKASSTRYRLEAEGDREGVQAGQSEDDAVSAGVRSTAVLQLVAKSVSRHNTCRGKALLP
ncbi:hypothetical protein [Gandjariella thermophila]|uniref:Uncharacterized protein n=1 Tax=Gandjariella thermophila TaxID=1931992 RepID=A0A4D4JAW3_9PSEU|nr:hypothetical protein [Gandjariella thermophila]GDY31576.1 hypothetical protein GTS_32090 [Gandjariella thermophila]